MILSMLLVQRRERHGVPASSELLGRHMNVKGTHRSAMCFWALVPLLVCVCVLDSNAFATTPPQCERANRCLCTHNKRRGGRCEVCRCVFLRVVAIFWQLEMDVARGASRR
jgi:hypothetical protein